MADTPRARLDGIEICRGIAATMVVFYHAARHLDHNYGVPLLMGCFQFGHAGVDLFFVISGFIIMYVHYNDIGNPARLGHYLRQRITRVMPTYWVALALTVAMGAGGSRGFPSLADLAWSASLVPSNRELLLDIAWTLRYEITFYALFCGLILHRGAGTAVLAFWLAGIVLAAAGGVDAGWLPGSLYGVFNLQFFFGMSVAYAMRNAVIPAPRLILATGIALFALVALAEDVKLIDGYADPARIAYGLPAAVIVTRRRSRRPPVSNDKRPVVADAGSCFLLDLPVPVHLYGPDLACLAGYRTGSGDASYSKLSHCLRWVVWPAEFWLRAGSNIR